MKQPYNTTIYNTALYMRLSRDDESYGDSVSIETQRTILQQYAKEQGLHVVGEYVDDGWSGTNFERPSFQRMMDDVEAGKVNCIVTKDLSRFGREHVMMDYYLEFLFPEKRVRYIAVAENEDTEKGLSDFVPFKNLFNEWFAKDTSKRGELAGFPDEGQVSSWAREALSWAVGEGIISGTAEGGRTILKPQGNATRAQVASILMRFIRNSEKA